MRNIAIFASGQGTNAQRIIEYFSDKGNVKVKLLLSNKKEAMALNKAVELGVDTVVCDRNDFYHSNGILEILTKYNIDYVVLAGFLWLVPENLIEAFPNRILNIHPALLPKYGGKGMYGANVHKAVVANKEKESGITIHYVNKEYDKGDVIFQAKCEVEVDDTPETLAKKIHQLEYRYFPEIIESVIL